MGFEIILNSLYICVKDMKWAVEFYEKFFGQRVDKKDDILSVFDLKGFRFWLFDNKKVNESITWGDNCLPSFEVNDIYKLIEKLELLGVRLVFPLTRIGDNLVLEFKDSEGNDIEVYSKVY